MILAALAALAVVAIVLVRRVRRRRALGPEQRADAQLVELRRALERLGWEVPAQTTLLGLERRLDRSFGPGAASYVAALRAHRYDPRAPGMPGAGGAAASRRALAAGGGLRTRLRSLRALPPGFTAL